MNRRRSKRRSFGKRKIKFKKSNIFEHLLSNFEKEKEIIGTIMFTDIVGSTKLWKNYPNQMKVALQSHENVISKYVKKYGGIVIKTIGDAFMVFFRGNESYKDALECSYKIQYDLDSDKIIVGDDNFISIRIGLCYGKVIERNVIFQDKKLKDYFGTTVNIASRMESKVSVKTSPSFAFCIHGIDDDVLLDKITDFIFKFYESNKLKIEIKEFKNDCENSKSSERLIKHDCDSIDKLNGVPELTAYLFMLY